MNKNGKNNERMTVQCFFKEINALEGTVCQIRATNKFKKSLNVSYRRNLDLRLLKEIIHTLAKGEKLNSKYCAHPLSGYKAVVMECHIKSDWLLVWQQIDKELVLILLDTGTHTDIFG